MREDLFRSVLALMCFILIIATCGCGKGLYGQYSEQHNQYSVSFANYSQKEKINYIVDYLETQYGLTAEISEVIKRQINSFSSEDMYYAIAKYDENSRIYCWVNDEGEVWDSKFINDLQMPVNRLFTEKISGKLNDFKIVCSCTLNSPSKKKWTESQIQQMLSSEDISVNLRIFVAADEKERAESQVDNAFGGAFSFASGKCYIYFVENTESIDQINLLNHDLCIDL